MFKNKEDYLNQRKALVDKAQSLFNEGKYKESISMNDDVEALDKAFEEFAKAQANLNALQDNHTITNIQDKSLNITESGVIDSFNNAKIDDQSEVNEPIGYSNMWAKSMLGLPLTNKEKEIISQYNEAYTHNTENTGILIPETVSSGIWKEVGEQYPLWNDVFKTSVPGKMTLLKSNSSSNAKWYDESTETEDGKELFGSVSLDGCELSRDITVSWKLKEMSIEEFIPFIQNQLSEKMGAALGYAVAQGKGKPGAEDTFEAEPKGIITELNSEEDTPQIVTFSDSDNLSYQKFTQAMGKIKGTYKNKACIYANSTTIWNEIANVTDENNRPYFIANPIDGGVGTVLGKIVKEDDGMPDNCILIGDAKSGYHANINKQISLDTEDHKKARKTDYIAYAIADGGVRTTKAFALIKKVD